MILITAGLRIASAGLLIWLAVQVQGHIQGIVDARIPHIEAAIDAATNPPATGDRSTP